ncbi:hypothetical protein VTL71DRAFT_14772 [Oculimacula yallundae]|uniref:Heterokaryon incompatibility domain-containing protein n=1 Tax=Oculimacula yallundae TaxID=86028 RepID=A0ABR4CK30_9HELO
MATHKCASISEARGKSKERKPVSSLSLNSSTTTTIPLCNGCSGLDFNRMCRLSWGKPDCSSQRYRHYSEDVTIGIPSLEHPCTFCDFLRSLSDFSSWKDKHERAQLTIMSVREDEFPLLKGSGVTLLQIIDWTSSVFTERRLFVAQSESIRPVRRIVEGASIDYSVVLEWMRLCQHLHPDGCRPPYYKVSGLKLIDCETRSIVSASNHKYVTLSYLWGDCERETLFTGYLPTEVPETIEDALLVTQQLGFRYLWIDRYCINQSNASETSAQLQVMGSIYRNSHLTIIAAAGDDPSYGLPGVRKRSRYQQAHAQIEHGYLREVHHIEDLVNSSRWRSRGWTYQEGILATRRLIFTDSQIYFECQGMSNYEMFNLPYADMHSPNQGQQIHPRYHNMPPGHSESKIGLYSGSNGNIFNQIEQFSLRELSHPSDRLRAFLGILEAFERDGHGLRHCWGIPILLETPPIIDSNMITLHSGFDSKEPLDGEDIRKYSVSSFIRNLMWEKATFKPHIRIEDLPSWSWTGVCGAIYFDAWIERSVTSPEEVECKIFDVEVAIECINGNVLPWTKYHEEYEVLGEGALSKYIHIKAWSAMAEIEPPNNDSIDVRYHKFHTLSISMPDGSMVVPAISSPTSKTFPGTSLNRGAVSHGTDDWDSTSMPELEFQATTDNEAEASKKEEVLIFILGQIDEYLMILVTRKTDICGEGGVDTWERVHTLFADPLRWWVLPRSESGEGKGGQGVNEYQADGDCNESENTFNGNEKNSKIPFGKGWWRSMKGYERRKIRLG